MSNKNLYKEIDEAVNAANDALYYLGNAEEILKSARNWGIADLLGGQMIISAIKNGKTHQAEIQFSKRALLTQLRTAVSVITRQRRSAMSESTK